MLTFKQPYSFYEDKSHISLKIKEIVKHMLLEPISMQYIAKEIGIMVGMIVVIVTLSIRNIKTRLE